MNEAAVLDRALRLARDQAAHDDELLRLLVRLRRRATVLLFRDAGRNAQGLSTWEVGDYHAPVTFVSRSAGVRALHMLARDKAIAVEAVNEAGADAARKSLERAIAEMSRHAPALADALNAGRCIREGVVLFRPLSDSPHILTERVRLASDSGNSLRSAAGIRIIELETYEGA